MKFLILCLVLVSGFASADDLTLEWAYEPETCANGEPLKQCIATGFEIQKKDSVGIWTILRGVSAASRMYIHEDQGPGVHCYRLRTNASGTFSAPSNEDCTTVAESPPPAPQPPVLTVTNPTAMSVRADWEALAFVPSKAVGVVPVGTPCDASRSLGNGYYGVDRSLVAFFGSNQPSNIVAKCGI